MGETQEQSGGQAACLQYDPTGTLPEAQVIDILDQMSEALYAVDEHWRITFVNRTVAELWGRHGHELLGKNLWEEFPQSVGTHAYDEYHSAMRERRSISFEYLSPVVERWFDVRAYPIGAGLVVYFNDITERKHAEERLAYHARVLENVHDAIVAADQRLILTSWNRAAEEMYGWTAAEVLGRDVREVVRSEFDAGQRAEGFRVLAETGHYRAEAVHHRKDGSRIWIEGAIMALRNAAGRVTGYVLRIVTSPSTSAPRRRCVRARNASGATSSLG